MVSNRTYWLVLCSVALGFLGANFLLVPVLAVWLTVWTFIYPVEMVDESEVCATASQAIRAMDHRFGGEHGLHSGCVCSWIGPALAVRPPSRTHQTPNYRAALTCCLISDWRALALLLISTAACKLDGFVPKGGRNLVSGKFEIFRCQRQLCTL